VANGELTGVPVSDPVPLDAVTNAAPAYADLDENAILGSARVLWTHVTSVTDLLPSPSAAAVVFTPKSNHYVLATFGTLPPPSAGVGIRALAPSRYLPCATCPLMDDVPDWSTDPQAQIISLRGLGREVDLTPGSATVAPVFGETGVRWAPVAEAGSWLDEAAPRLVSVTSDGTAVHAAIGFADGALFQVASASSIRQGGDLPHVSVATTAGGVAPPSRSGFGVVLSGYEGAVFVVGGTLSSGSPAGDAWWFDLQSGQWFQLGLSGTLPGTVLGATYRAADRSLYVVDVVPVDTHAHGPLAGLVGVIEGLLGQDRAHVARLLRISLDDMSSTVLQQTYRHPAMDSAWISVGPSGELVVVASSAQARRYTGMVLQVNDDGSIARLASIRGSGVVALEPSLTANGLTVPIVDGANVRHVYSPGFPASTPGCQLWDVL
jgi:hypothetical protein